MGIAAVVAVGAATFTTVPAAEAAKGKGKAPVQSDVARDSGNYNQGKALRISKKKSEPVRKQAPKGPAKVGRVSTWLALDDSNDSIYLKNYTLRGVGDNIEVWVANDLRFPEGDCRNSLGLTDITTGQVNSFINEFDNNIYPIESAKFSTPPSRDGSNAILPKLVPSIPSSEYKGEGDNIVVLVDNVRDDNYYAPTTPDGQTYIAGFHYSTFNEYFDRNVMTIDAYDWLHRTGSNPPDDSTDPAYAACSAELEVTPSRLVGLPHPRLYEGVFAHEYQHLLEYYASPGEASWINEGLSDFAQTLVGYVDPSLPVDDPNADGHINCFLGWQAADGFGGPENSLTQWGDQGDPEILCDYGAAYTFMQYLDGHYGDAFMTALHNEDLNSLEGLTAVLDQRNSDRSAMDTIHDWAAAMALDHVVDGGAPLNGGPDGRYSEDSLDASINWAATYGDINHDGTFDDPGNEAYSTPGAPPNGSDYVRLADGSGNYLNAGDLTSLTFDGAATLASDPLEWTVGSGRLYSGSGPDFDRTLIREVTVPTANPALTFDTEWETEEGWDFGVVQVSTDNGATWASLSNADTTSAHDPDAEQRIVDQLPGFTGSSGGVRNESFDLSAYAGQSVLLGFRYLTDGGVDLPGWWVDNVKVGGNLISDGSSLAGWQSASQISPTPVSDFRVRLIGYTDDGSAAWIHRVPVTQNPDGTFSGSMDAAALEAAVGTSAETVAALVMQDDPTGTVRKYAGYELRVNGVLQPGG